MYRVCNNYIFFRVILAVCISLLFYWTSSKVLLYTVRDIDFLVLRNVPVVTISLKKVSLKLDILSDKTRINILACSVSLSLYCS